MAAILLILGVLAVAILSFIIFYEPKEKPYILNKNTFEIHNMSCPCVEDMRRRNMKFITKQKRDELIAKDSEYMCGRCKSK